MRGFELMSDLVFNCFVIMPFSQSSQEHSEQYWTSHFNNFLKPIIEEVSGVQAFRIETLREDILKQIITNLVVSPIVIAELTDHNPNVFWELGVRQSFKHNTITIAEEGTVLPFDISAKTTLFYNRRDEKKIPEFRSKLKEAIIDCIENPNKSDSHVLDTLSGRGSLYEIMNLDEVKRRIESLIIETKTNLIHFINAQKVLSELKDDSYIPYELRYAGSVWKTGCLELLLSTRYLDEDVRFYNALRSFYEALSEIAVGCKDLNSMVEDERNFFLDPFGKTPINKVMTRMFHNTLNLLKQAYQNINKRLQSMPSETIMREFEDLKPMTSVGNVGWKPYKKRKMSEK